MINRRLARAFCWLKRTWRPHPVDKPVVDLMFKQMDAIQRSAESFRYSILSWEFWASPNGQVREWMRHNTRLVVLLFIPALIILPIIGFALAQVAAFTVALTVIGAHLIVIPVLFLLLVGIIKFIISIFR